MSTFKYWRPKLKESDFKLTPNREKELEKIAKDLPDADFKKRYGKDWKSVKIATAMNILKKKQGFKTEAVDDSKADLMLDQGKDYVLKQTNKDYDRGLLVSMNEDGSYGIAYWYDELKPYPIEVLIDGKSVKKDAKNIKLNFHPELDEASERTPRKKGQHRGSSSHSDLYTDENPKGTIKGLGFKDAETANKGVGIIDKSGKKHAHQVQATLVMQQRAKEAIKRTKDPEKKANLKDAYKIWTDHLEKLKKKTKEMNK